MDFLCDPCNKDELFAFLTSRVAQFTFPPNKAVYVTSGDSVESTGPNMVDCNHEEADTRIVVHILHALELGMKTIKVRTVDTDVVVILAGIFHELVETQPLADIWIAFGKSKNYRFYNIADICAHIGEHKSRALPFFHAFTGSDTTSAFRGKGKKSAWQAWQAYEGVTETFEFLSYHPFEILEKDSDHFRKIERFSVVLYDRTSPLTSVNEAREELFCRKNRAPDKIPPTQDALLQHARRAVYQAGIWTTSTQAQQIVPTPREFAWVKESDVWVLVWITIPEVSKACRELVKCSCSGNCSNCKCGPCSPLCNCNCNSKYSY